VGEMRGSGGWSGLYCAVARLTLSEDGRVDGAHFACPGFEAAFDEGSLPLIEGRLHGTVIGQEQIIEWLSGGVSGGHGGGDRGGGRDASETGGRPKVVERRRADGVMSDE